MEKHNWKIRSLGEVVEFLDGKRIPLKDSERASMKGEVPYYGANGKIDSINKYIFNEPLILLAEDGGHFGSKTKPIAYKIDGKSWVNNHAHVLRPMNSLNIDFLKWSLAFYDVSKFITGSTRVKLTKGDALKMQIPIPDLKTQQKIAGILEQVDAARQRRKQANQLTEQFLQSAFLEMFGDPVRNQKGWDEYTAEKYCSKLTVGVVIRPASFYVDKGVIALRSLNIKPNRINLDNIVYFSKETSKNKFSKSILNEGDVVFVRTGVTGTAAIIPKELDGCNCIDLIITRPKKELMHPVYLTHFFNSEFGKKVIAAKNVGGIQQHFNIGALKHISIPCPPYKLQNKFGLLVDQVEQMQVKQRESEKELDNLFLSLMQKYFG